MPIYTKLFILFFFAVFFSYYFILYLFRRKKAINVIFSGILLLMTSLAFYAYSNFKFIPYLLGLGLVTYILGIFMEKIPSCKKIFLVISVLIQVSPLALSRFYGLTIRTFSLPGRNLLLPLGLSCRESLRFPAR